MSGDGAGPGVDMHAPTPEDAAAARALTEWALARLAHRRAYLPARPASGPLPPLTHEGVGTAAALATFRETVATAARLSRRTTRRYFAFVPGTPTVAAALADMALSAAMIYGGSRLEAGAAVEAEDAVIRWLADWRLPRVRGRHLRQRRLDRQPQRPSAAAARPAA